MEKCKNTAKFTKKTKFVLFLISFTFMVLLAELSFLSKYAVFHVLDLETERQCYLNPLMHGLW